MTPLEAIHNALVIAQQIDVRGKQNIANLLYVMQVLESLQELHEKACEEGAENGNNTQTAMES